MVNGALIAPSLPSNRVSRGFSICFAIAAGMAAALLHLKEIPLVTESIEQRLVFDPLPADLKQLKALPSLAPGVEEVRLVMPDGVVLHGWLKRPARQRPGERYPLVIVYGGGGRAISEFGAGGCGAGAWGWLWGDYPGLGVSRGL